MDRFELALLRDYYGSLLTEKQNEILRLRYDEDLSFGEISEIMGISRQAVLDSLNKGEEHLIRFEENLKCLERYRKITFVIDGLGESADIEDYKRALRNIKEIMED